jgi:hypothetical protein
MDQKNDMDMQFNNELKESIAKSVSLHTDKDFALKSEKRVGLLDTLPDVMNVELPKEFFADCAVWDFAGQKEFYATHQTFLTNCAIYLLTADLSKDLSSQRLTKIYDVDFGKVGCKLCCYLIIGLWCLMPLSTIFLLYRDSEFIGGGNQSTRRKPPTCRNSLTIFIT